MRDARVMRRAIQQGRALELEQGFLTRYAERVQELMGGAYPELREQGAAIATSRIGRAAAPSRANAVTAGVIASSQGSAIETPNPLRTVRREICFPVKNIRELQSQTRDGLKAVPYELFASRARPDGRALPAPPPYVGADLQVGP